MIQARMRQRDLPTGTVSFVFTDVEGSTKLLHELGLQAYAEALAEHRRVVREACAAHGGVEVDTQGDAFFFAFPTAPGAIEAARTIAKDLASGPIQVRIGLHTGTPLVTDEGYVGPDVHRAARIAAAGHGGQILVSSAAAALLGDQELRDLGEHRFKDLAVPERVYQVGREDFRSLKSLYRTNLPVPATPFLGRERELAEVVTLVTDAGVRLLTLTGPGGTGKTRLALQAAAEASDHYPDGVYWVPLAPLRDPALILPAVAQTLEVKEEPGTPLAESLQRSLAGKHALLLLDNAEHLLPQAAAEIAVLQLGTGPVLVVTSRERLQIQGEQVYPVPTLEHRDGVDLFHARARALAPEFSANGVVAELCSRLDNLPLALELAAARTVVFTPEQLLERLSQRLDLLKGGRNADPRQQTLRATIEWSYDLLELEDRRLFRSLSVFAGGCTYEAAEEVCGAEPDTLQSLLDKSLLRRRDTDLGPRYWMLETIREFARERLEQHKETVACMQGLVEHLSLLAEAVEPRLSTSEQANGLAQLEAEHDNIRAALGWVLECGEVELALRLAASMGRFWLMSDYLVEGGRWLESALNGSPGADPTLRAKALVAAGSLAHYLNDQDRAEEWFNEARSLAQEIGERGILGYALIGLGNVADERDQVELAISLEKEALELFRATANARGIRVALNNLGERAVRSGDPDLARSLLDETIALSRQEGDVFMLCSSLDSLGALALRTSDALEATNIYRELLLAARAGGFRRVITYGFAGLAAAASLRDDVSSSGRLWGAVEMMEDELGFRLVEAERLRYERLIRGVSDAHPEGFAKAFREGRSLGPDEAMEYALEGLSD